MFCSPMYLLNIRLGGLGETDGLLTDQSDDAAEIHEASSLKPWLTKTRSDLSSATALLSRMRRYRLRASWLIGNADMFCVCVMCNL